MVPIDITYLNRSAVEELSLTNDKILSAVEASLKAQGEGQSVMEPRAHLVPEDSAKGHFNVLRGFVKSLGLAGVKVLGDFVGNYKRALPSELAVLNHFDLETGVPNTLIDATRITEIRAGAIMAIGAKYLARKNNKILRHIGARRTSYWNVRQLDHLFDFKEIKDRSRRPESRNAFTQRLESDLGKPVVVTEYWEACVREADIVVEAPRLTELTPLLKTDWIKISRIVVPYGALLGAGGEA